MTQANTEDLDLLAQEKIVSRGFWPKLRRFAANLPFAEEAVAAYYCAFDRTTPTRVRLTLLGALGYFIVPFDAVADFLPLIGFADDAGVLSAAILAVGSSINDSHREAARAALTRLAGDAEA
jgi:uncharacterized membrane protein YkvA (DUF1232 family)